MENSPGDVLKFEEVDNNEAGHRHRPSENTNNGKEGGDSYRPMQI